VTASWSWAARSARWYSGFSRCGRTRRFPELIDGIWGEDPPPSAVNALHVHVAGLRRALEPHRASRAPGKFLLAAGPGYSLRLEPGDLDAQVFGRHLDAAREWRTVGDLSAAAREFDAALRLWQAVPLSGAPGPWA